ncbi:MAG: glutamyl-tRNA reductase [Anaerolineae bacterium]
MTLLLLGLNHTVAPVEVRERLAISPGRLPELLATLRATEGVNEVAVLSTCNRFEIYAVVADAVAGKNALLDSLGACDLNCYIYTQSDRAATLHLCRVAAGLDSLLLGEHEILGQVKTALQAALDAGTAGALLSQAFRSAIAAGKRAQTETEIGASLHSLGEVAVALAQQHLGDLADRTALVIGVGRIGKVAAQALIESGLRWVLIANRSYERAAEFAETLGGRAVHFDALVDHLVKADLVIVATGAPHLVLHEADLRRAMFARQGHPLIVVDLAVPRNVDPAARAIPGISLYDIDDLSEIVKTQHHVAAPAIAKAEAIAAAAADGFIAWLQQRRIVPLVRDLLAWSEKVRAAETDKCLKRLALTSEADIQALEALSTSLTHKLLYVAIRAIKSAAIEQGELELPVEIHNHSW